MDGVGRMHAFLSLFLNPGKAEYVLQHTVVKCIKPRFQKQKKLNKSKDPCTETD